MPIIKSAIKKARQGEVHRKHNRAFKDTVKDALDAFKKNPSAKLYSQVTSLLDKAAKKNIIHPNKAARLKSRLSKLLSGKKAAVQVKTSTPKKSPRKKSS